MVHAKMYSTIHKSALSQQNNKTFFFPPRPVKASPFIFTSEPRKCKERQEAAQRAKANRWVWVAGGMGVEREGWEGRAQGGRVTVGKAQSQSQGKRESDDKDARGDKRWGWRSWERVEEVSTLK